MSATILLLLIAAAIWHAFILVWIYYRAEAVMRALHSDEPIEDRILDE